MTLEHSELVGKIRDVKFLEIYNASSRRTRNMLEGMYARKAKKGRMVSIKSGKNKKAIALSVKTGIHAKGDDQMAEELLKNWLYHKPTLLKAALDFFGIENENGITEQELDPLLEADAETLSSMMDELTGSGHDPEEVAIYLAFHQAENFDAAPKLAEVNFVGKKV